eukprot:376923-Amphidinium_carterae.1
MALGDMPCFLHAAYTPPALDFLGAGCALSFGALRLSGGALDARGCAFVSGPADPDGGIDATLVFLGVGAFRCCGSWTKPMSGSAWACSELVCFCPLGCFGSA